LFSGIKDWRNTESISQQLGWGHDLAVGRYTATEEFLKCLNTGCQGGQQIQGQKGSVRLRDTITKEVVINLIFMDPCIVV
jgi:hypothetical protein